MKILGIFQTIETQNIFKNIFLVSEEIWKIIVST